MDKEIRNPKGERLDYSFHEATPGDVAKNNGTLVILGHGVTGNKDRPILVNTAKALNNAGFDTLRFSFAGNGESEGDFREATITKECGDLESVLNAVEESASRIIYIGHSMGAAVGVLISARDNRISALVSLAGMVDTKAFAQREFGDLQPDKDVMWEEADCPLSSAFMEDLSSTVGTVLPSAESIDIPWLLVHGTADDIVLPEDSESVRNKLGDGVDLVSVDGANHVFSEPEHSETAANSIVKWLREKLQTSWAQWP